jgi:hypothetical protein
MKNNNVDGEKKKKDEKRMELEFHYSFINNLILK